MSLSPKNQLNNQKIIRGEETIAAWICTLYACEVEGKCQTKAVIYQCEVKQTYTGHMESYVGLTENTFKDRLTMHRSSINTEGCHRNSLSTHIWDLKRRNINFNLPGEFLPKVELTPHLQKWVNCVWKKSIIFYLRTRPETYSCA